MAVLFKDTFDGTTIDLHKWRFEKMQKGLHRVGNEGIDRDGNIDPKSSAKGKRWDLWYDRYHKELATVQDGMLALRAKEVIEHDPTRQGTYMENRRLYGVWVDTWTRNWTPDGHVAESLFQFKVGSKLTMRVNFENQKVPGARSSAWMMAAEIKPERYVEVDLFEYDPANPDVVFCKVVTAEGLEDTPGGQVHFPGIGKGWHTFTLTWEDDRLAWEIDGKMVVEDREKSRIPTEELYLILSREGNNGTKELKHYREGNVLEKPPYMPASPGLFGKNIFDNSHLLNDDYVLIDSVTVESLDDDMTQEVSDEEPKVDSTVESNNLERLIRDSFASVNSRLDTLIERIDNQSIPMLNNSVVEDQPVIEESNFVKPENWIGDAGLIPAWDLDKAPLRDIGALTQDEYNVITHNTWRDIGDAKTGIVEYEGKRSLAATLERLTGARTNGTNKFQGAMRLPKDSSHIKLRFLIHFPPGFDFGGDRARTMKMGPGIFFGNKLAAGGMLLPDGGSLRPSYHARKGSNDAVQPSPYIYHQNQKRKYGDFQLADIDITTGEWHEVYLEGIAQSAPGMPDGVGRMWWNGKLIYQDENMMWVKHGRVTSDQIVWGVFMGGGNTQEQPALFSPDSDQTMYIAEYSYSAK